MHPEFVAKSYFPGRLLQDVGLEAIGSRPTRARPAKWTRKGEPDVVETTDLFVAAPRAVFERWAHSLPEWGEQQVSAPDLSHIEAIRPQESTDRIQPINTTDERIFLEVVLHASADRRSEFIIEAFEAWLKSLDSMPLIDRRLHVGGLCFLPVSAPTEKLSAIAEFTFIRTVRQMPRLRMLKPPIIRTVRPRRSCQLPTANALSATSSVAIFDGGMSPTSPLTKWITPVDPPGIGPSVPEYLEHGHQVSSALLFGGIDVTGKPEIPFSTATHYRVLDSDSPSDPLELYDVLQRIRNVLGSQRYDFINLSIGPELPIEDTDVHAWTAFLDEHLEDGNVLAAIAVGNGGENDRETGNARIQVPSDSVNGLAIGACDSPSIGWSRALYSSFGPGRSPGMVKPDCVDFGGSESEPFNVVDSTDPTRLDVTMGTSFATPAALRTAIGIRSYLGPIMTPLALKALLIHCTECDTDDRTECGWGRVAQSIEDHIICPDGTARIIYQGELTPAQFLRAQIPVPTSEMKGKVGIRATFCYATRTDPEHPGNYTRSGLDVKFRPHDQRFTVRPGADVAPGQPDSKPFFQLREFSNESELRRDAHKWETTLHRAKFFKPQSLRNPVFDIHYVAREGGAPVNVAQKIRYALVVTVSAPKTADLYDNIRRRYSTILVPLRPVISVPLYV
ncbi:MAG TPA: S8 family peptidase [Chthoniobacterales bacterium]|nr:S8 family peptidase [Chthoniobacterales bacterium]